MGVDLTLVPLDALEVHSSGRVRGHGNSLLDLGRQRLCWDAINAMKPEAVPADAEISAGVAKLPDGDRGYGVLTTTPYGDPYTWVDADALAQVLAKFPPQAAAAAYLAKLPPDTKIILHWH